MDVTKFLKTIEGAGFYKKQVVHRHTIPVRRAKYKELSRPLPKKLGSVLGATGIKKLYTHQVYAIESLREGNDVVIVTSTASGKTLCYNVPVLESLLEEPESRALYLYPTKALAQDQLRVLNRDGSRHQQRQDRRGLRLGRIAHRPGQLFSIGRCRTVNPVNFHIANTDHGLKMKMTDKAAADKPQAQFFEWIVCCHNQNSSFYTLNRRCRP